MSGTLVTPRFRVLMNGELVLGVKEINITLANVFQVGKFSLTKAFVDNDPFPLSWWAATKTKTMLVEIDVSTDGQTFTQIITGNVDSHRLDMAANTVTVAGRDLAAAFLDRRNIGTFKNQNAGEIVQSLAAGHIYQADVTSATTPLIGRTYNIDATKTAGHDFADATNEWDLICRLGSQVGIVPYMQGNTLYFNPPPANPPVYPVTFSRNEDGSISSVEGLSFERHMTVARDIIVMVQSWHGQKKAAFSATYKVKTKDQPPDGTDETPIKYVFTVPNLTQAQCATMAYQKALDISTHERNTTIVAPSFVLLTPLHVIQVSGTGTDYDMTFYPREISYVINFDGGATTNIQAKFSSPVFLYDNDSGEQVGEQA